MGGTGCHHPAYCFFFVSGGWEPIPFWVLMKADMRSMPWKCIGMKDWIISTYNGEIDYFNLKPPLSMYMIMCGYALFGMNTFGIRVGSAFCYLLTALISAGYVAQKKSCWAASFTMFLFGSSKLLLFCSMAEREMPIYGALCIYHGASIKEGKALLKPDRLTLVLWILIPCVIYAIPTTKLITYSYPSYIALYICGGLLLPDLLKQTESRHILTTGKKAISS